ncbi:hypothetical protein F4809DRAFT_646205 [Biscogniauxia mediterranea]|nr:hypothetical protein F4809DRAFT_646205 [Biscogniauxia mediterranea]
MAHQSVRRLSDSDITAIQAAREIASSGSLERHLSQLQIPKNEKIQLQAMVDTTAKVETQNETAISKRFPEFRFFCVNCGGKFNPMDNKNDSCYTHPGMFTQWLYSGKNWKGEEVDDLEQWTCCRETHPLHPGCKVRRHVALSETVNWK